MESKNENLLEVKMIMWKAAWKMENHEDEAGLRGAQNTEWERLDERGGGGV